VDVKETLDRLTPETARLPDWDRVLREARPSRARWAAPRLAIVSAVVGLAALLAIAPWRGAERTGILDRALAAVSDGPVLHAFVREGWGADLVDLRTGKHTWQEGEREVWYDPARGLHSVSRLGGAHVEEQLWRAGDVPRIEASTYGFLAEGYREALAAGRAQLVGQGVVDGTPVYWIRVHQQASPADTGLLVRDVAVSRESYKPVATRGTPGTGPDSQLLIGDLEMLPPGEGDFTKGGSPSWADRPELHVRAEQIELAVAASVLGREPLWLGPEHAGLRLAKVGRRGKAIQTVYSNDPVPQGWASLRPKYEGRFVVVHQGIDPQSIFLFGVTRGYTPPEGKGLYFGGFALLRHDGMPVAIQASSEELTLSAARALRPLSAENAAGG
jgi:hypothetical protein